jgi:hypothetical protein
VEETKMKAVFITIALVLVSAMILPNCFPDGAAAAGPTATFTLQPGPGLNDGTDDGSAAKGKDTWINNAYATSPGDQNFYLWNISCNSYRGGGLLRFSLDGLPAQNIVSAKIYMYTSVYFNGSGSPWPAGDQQVSVRKLTADWNETTASWGSQPACDPAIIDPHIVTTVGNALPSYEFQDWIAFDITDLYKGWANGSVPNYGILFHLDTSVCQNGDEFTMWTSDYLGDTSLRPKLVVTYNLPTPAPIVTAVNPASGLQGQCPMTVVITGANLSRPTAGSGGPGITVKNYTVDSDTQITVTICIAADAPPGARNVSVTTPGGTFIKTGAFTVVPQSPLIGSGAPASYGSSVTTPATFAPPVSLPNILVQSASLSATAVTPGAPVTVTADIINKSTVNGNKKVTVYVNGQVETAQAVTVNSGSSSKLTFNLSRSEPGDYTVYVDGVPAGGFKVDLFRESDGILIFSAAMVALAFLIGMVVLWRRQRAG